MFEFKRAETPTEMEWVYRLRFQVYCIERGFEDATDHPGGLEKDEFDAHSSHFLCLAEDGAAVGTIRLILPTDQPFPMTLHCTVTDPVPEALSGHLGEISRLAISKSYRRRDGDTIYGLTDDPGGGMRRIDRRQLPVLCLGLLRAGYQESLRHGITFIYAAMEPNLHRLLGLYGIQFEPVGPEISYHGMRTPHLLRLEDLEHTLTHGSRRWRKVYEYFREDLPEALTATALVAGRRLVDRHAATVAAVSRMRRDEAAACVEVRGTLEAPS